MDWLEGKCVWPGCLKVVWLCGTGGERGDGGIAVLYTPLGRQDGGIIMTGIMPDTEEYPAGTWLGWAVLDMIGCLMVVTSPVF